MISLQSRRLLSWSQWAAGKLTWDVWQDWTCVVTKDSHSQILYHIIKTRVELRNGLLSFQLFRLVFCTQLCWPQKPGLRSRYSDWLRAGRPRVRCLSPAKFKNSLFSTVSRPDLGPTQPPIQWVPGILSTGVKLQGSEADHSPAASAEVKKIWIYTSTPPYVFME
jgi:hypothetical protein